jgi:hypothetical protein
VDAILVGEALLSAEAPAAMAGQLCGLPRGSR